MRLLKERNRGYAGSIKEDEAREANEEREKRRKEEEEAKERERSRQLDERRQDLLESLIDEPALGTAEEVITIALRFNDGKRDQRRFLAESTRVNDVCNWIDATHGIEREKLELSTMNGSRKFAYDEEDSMTLKEAGLAKMTALRVLELEEVVKERSDEGNEIENEDEKEEDDQDEEDDE